MPEGGDVLVETLEDNDQVVISVMDNGSGINPEDLPHIFEPFFTHRADGQKGIGLGLTISQSIIEKLGGKIDVDIRPDKYHTRFRVTV